MERLNRFYDKLSQKISLTKAVTYLVFYSIIGLIGLVQTGNYLLYRDPLSLLSGPIFLFLAVIGAFNLIQVVRAIKRRERSATPQTVSN
jgi:hypothetical protein